MIVNKTEFAFPFYFLGLLTTTYLGMGEYYIMFFFVLALGIKLLKTRKKMIFRKNPWFLFIGYYFVVSIFGLITGYVGIKNLMEFMLKYMMLPFTIYAIMPQKENVAGMIRIVKGIILVCALFGLVEYVMKYNIMVNFVQLGNRVWMAQMNGRTINYQPASLFLHYNYYGCVLVAGIVMNKYFPYQKVYRNVIYFLLIGSQLLLCQSRICWISIAAIATIWLFTSKRIANKVIKGIGIALLIVLIIVLYDPTIVSSVGRMINARISRLFEYGLEDGSLGQRLGTLMNWPEYFSQNPLGGIIGTGYQSISVEFMPMYSYFRGYSTADCELTVYLIETGIIGISIAFVAIVRFLRSQIKQKNEIGFFCAICLTGFLIECITLDIVSNNIIMVLLLMCIVLGLKYNRGQKERCSYELSSILVKETIDKSKV